MMRRAALATMALSGLLLAGCGPTIPPHYAQDTTSQAPPPATAASVVPTGLRIPSIGVDNRRFMQLGLAGDKSLEVPPLNQPLLIGWFKLGPVPGDSALCSFQDGCVQPAVLVSHINGNGMPGGFAKLAQLKAGATVEVDRSDGKTAVFKVNKVSVFKKTDFDSKAIYGVSGPSLQLITCGGGSNRLETLPNGQHSYVNQTVATANLVELKPSSP